MLNTEYTPEQVKKIGYGVICLVMREIAVAAKRVAFSGELRSLKMQMDPAEVDLVKDRALLAVLEEPQVKLSSLALEYIQRDILEPYSVINLLDDDDIISDDLTLSASWRFIYRFAFWRSRNRRRDRYLNYGKMLRSTQRVVFECCKLMISGNTRVYDMTYRSNYSPGRLKALARGNTDSGISLLFELIAKLKEWELENKGLSQYPYPSIFPRRRFKV